MALQGYRVDTIPSQQAVPYVLHRHYARAVPSMVYTYGLFNPQGNIVGVCVFGSPANMNNNTIAGRKALELTRLFIEDGEPKNAASYLVSRSLSAIPKGLAIVSYADPHQSHHGYVYQATNWFYVGQGQRKDGGIDSGVTAFVHNITGKKMHARSFGLRYGPCTSDNATKNGYTRTFTKPKHKYLYFTGTKKERDAFIAATGLSILTYPKGDNVRYDTGTTPEPEIKFMPFFEDMM